jgi:hypothetical protein
MFFPARLLAISPFLSPHSPLYRILGQRLKVETLNVLETSLSPACYWRSNCPNKMSPFRDSNTIYSLSDENGCDMMNNEYNFIRYFTYSI